MYCELQSQGYHVQLVLVERKGASDKEVVEVAISRGKMMVVMYKGFGVLPKRIGHQK